MVLHRGAGRTATAAAATDQRWRCIFCLCRDFGSVEVPHLLDVAVALLRAHPLYHPDMSVVSCFEVERTLSFSLSSAAGLNVHVDLRVRLRARVFIDVLLSQSGLAPVPYRTIVLRVGIHGFFRQR